jgi:protein SCO1/2
MSVMTGLLLIVLQSTVPGLLPQSRVPGLNGVGVEQKLGNDIDRSIEFRDERGASVRFGDLLRGRPIILTPVYYDCPMLCSLQLNALVRALKVMPETAGETFDIVSFSIDPRETVESARRSKDHYVRDYRRPRAADGWTFLTADAAAVQRLTNDIGFRFAQDPSTGQIAHVSALIVLTPDGRISQYFTGIEYDPADLKASLAKASDGRTGSLIEQALLYCYEYDPSTGRYSLSIIRITQLGGVATVMGLIALGWWASRQRKPA